MTKWYRDINVWTIIGESTTGIVAFGLLIAGFLLPPTGVIDSSVIQAVGEIMGFATIWMLPKAITAGKNIKLERAGSTITIGGDSSKNE